MNSPRRYLSAFAVLPLSLLVVVGCSSGEAERVPLSGDIPTTIEPTPSPTPSPTPEPTPEPTEGEEPEPSSGEELPEAPAEPAVLDEFEEYVDPSEIQIDPNMPIAPEDSFTPIQPYDPNQFTDIPTNEGNPNQEVITTEGEFDPTDLDGSGGVE